MEAPGTKTSHRGISTVCRLALAGTALAALAGCQGSPGTSNARMVGPSARVTRAEKEADRFAVRERDSAGWIDTGAVSTGGSPASGSASGKSLPMAAPASEAARSLTDSPSALPPSGGMAGAGVSGGTPAMGREYPARRNRPQESLQAGEVDDNKLLEKYIGYTERYDAGGGVHRFDARERYRIRVADASGDAVPDAQVSIQAGGNTLFKGRTGTRGEVLFFPAALDEQAPQSLTVTARHGDQVATSENTRDPAGGTWTVKLESRAADRKAMTLDLLFLVDTTGSMSEEISRVRDTIQSVSNRIKALPARPTLRLGMVLYRDKGDEYVTRRRPFTSDVDAFQAALRGVRADGGGDEPEDLNAGLQQAIEAMDWTPNNAVRMMFVIADAPPHLDYQDEYDYFLGARRAVEKGIQIIGVSTMGTNDVGEFVFRQLALLTQGRFVFITRGGERGETPHKVDRQDYSVQRLDDLIVRLVSEELAPLTTDGRQAQR